VVTCTLAGSLGIGADASDITLTATLGAQAYPTVTNTATVSSTDPDLPGSATASDPVTVEPSAALRVLKAHVGTFVVGKAGNYLLTVSNSGPTATPGPVVVTDKLPAGLSYDKASGTGWLCTASGSNVTCTRAGALAAGASSTLTIVVNVLAAAYPSVTNTATATGTGSPPATGADTAPVTPTVDLGITKVLSSYKDNLASYRITVSNSGPNATVKPIVVTDKLQTGLSYRSATGTSWACTDSANTVTCIRTATLAVGASSSITLVALVNAAAGSKIVNVATVSGGGVAGSTGKTSPVGSAVLAVAATGSTGGGNGSLPQTGRDSRDPLIIAVTLLLLGLGLLLLGRRRPTS
jgi:large repetitive protein